MPSSSIKRAREVDTPQETVVPEVRTASDLSPSDDGGRNLLRMLQSSREKREREKSERGREGILRTEPKIRYLLMLCDKCRIVKLETIEGDFLPPHVRHFCQAHLEHSIRFIITGDDPELIAGAYAIHPEPGIFLEKKKDKDAFMKRLKELVPNSAPTMTLEESARLLAGQSPEGSLRSQPDPRAVARREAAFSADAEERRRRRE